MQIVVIAQENFPVDRLHRENGFFDAHLALAAQKLCLRGRSFFIRERQLVKVCLQRLLLPEKILCTVPGRRAKICLQLSG